MTLNTGWKMTRVTGPRWPLREYFSGGLGIHSDGFCLSRTWPPTCISFSVSANRASRSMTYKWHIFKKNFVFHLLFVDLVENRWWPSSVRIFASNEVTFTLHYMMCHIIYVQSTSLICMVSPETVGWKEPMTTRWNYELSSWQNLAH